MNARTCIVNSLTSKTPGPVRVSRNIYTWDGSRTQTHISKFPGPWQMSRSLYTCLKMIHGFKPTSVNSLIIDRCLETFTLAWDGSRIQTHISKFPGPWQMSRNLYTCLRWITDSNPHQWCSSFVQRSTILSIQAPTLTYIFQYSNYARLDVHIFYESYGIVCE
jgi:hypothetical protein